MGDLPSTLISGAPYQLMVHPIIMGYPGEPDIFNRPCARGLSLREIGNSRLGHARSRCFPFEMRKRFSGQL
jgi:hypothetical protein